MLLVDWIKSQILCELQLRFAQTVLVPHNEVTFKTLGILTTYTYICTYSANEV